MSSPYPFFRRGQLEAVEFVKSCLGNYLALKAPTGYGKTLVALMGHAGRGKVLYVVRTRNEISPVVRESRKLGITFTAVFSGRRMCPLLKGADVPAEDFWLNCRLLRLKSMCPYFTNLKHATPDEVVDLLARVELIDPHQLALLVAREFSACPFFALSGLSSRADVTIATYPYLFNESTYSTAFQDVGLDEFYVVIDEAHTLISPQSILSDSIGLPDLRNCSSELSRSGYSDLSHRLKQAEEVLVESKSKRLTRISKDSVGFDLDLAKDLEEALQEIRLVALSSLREFGVEAFIRVASSVSRVTKFLSIATKELFSLYTNLVADVPRLYALPLGFEPVRRRLTPARGVLLMSGTLPPKEVLDRVVGRETMYLDIEASYGHVFPRENVFYAVYTPLTTSYTLRSTRMFMEYANLVYSVYEKVDKAVLAVYPSYEVMDEVVTYLGKVGSVYTENEKTKIGDVAKTVSDEPHTLINAVAGGKIVEGVEFRDGAGVSLISAVAICGLPYPYPDDYVEDFRATLRRDLGTVADTLVMDTQASIRVVQACGRAVRSEKDRAFIILADRRFLKKGFKELLGFKYDAVFSDLACLLGRLNEFFRASRAE